MRRIVRHGLRLSAAALFLSSLFADAALAGPSVALTLINGWKNKARDTASASVRLENGIVYFRGGISDGTADTAFVLPPEFTPVAKVFVSVILCNRRGNLFINTTGVVRVLAQFAFSDAQCFTSLDGASFALSPSNFKPLTLKNGWTGAPLGTQAPAVRLIKDVVHFEGAIATDGTNAHPFLLPLKFRPAANVYVPVDTFAATKGRLYVEPSGKVSVQPETSFSDAAAMTSLEGASFAVNPTASTPLALINGWTTTPYATANPAVRKVGNVVQLEGAIATAGTNPVPFVLPAGFRPGHDVYVAIDLCASHSGALHIRPSGVVKVLPQSSVSDMQCFTSLEGASFRPN